MIRVGSIMDYRFMIEFLHYNQLNLYEEWIEFLKTKQHLSNDQIVSNRLEKSSIGNSNSENSKSVGWEIHSGFYFREMLHRSSTVSIKGTISARNGSDELTSNYISAILYFQKIHKARASRYRSCLLTEFIFDAVSLHADIHHATTNFHVRLLFPSLSGFFTALVFFQASTRETIHW